MNRVRWMLALCLTVAMAGVIAPQDVPMPGPEEDGQERESRGSTLRPRPDSDPGTEAWVTSLGAARPEILSVEEGVMLRHVMSPDGRRLYYFRVIEEVEEGNEKPAGRRYALYTVGPGRSETRVAETGGSCIPPLFLGDGRLLFTTCRYDLNADGVLDALDPSSLMIGNRDGGNLRHVATLDPGDVPVAVWRDDSEVLIATEGDEGVNGWIVSLNLVSGERENIVAGFNVELVLDDGRLLIERQLPSPEEADRPRGWNRWGQPVIPEEQDEEPEPTLLDHSAHIIFNPEDGSEVTLFSPGRRARVTVAADGSFFGHQERENVQNNNPWVVRSSTSRSVSSTEVLIVDDPQHRDTRSPSERFNYMAIGWIRDRGLLVVEQRNLGSRLLLFDLALKVHRLADFSLNARGFCAAEDGLTVGWLEVEDTDENGFLEPWKDHSRPRILTLE